MILRDMFDIPDARRIKRSELFPAEHSSNGSPPVSKEPSPPAIAAEERLKVNYGFEYDFIPLTNGSQIQTQPSTISAELVEGEDVEDHEGEATYQFRLFTSKRTSKSQPSKADHARQAVCLSATPEPSELTETLSLDKAHFIRPHRPDSFYFTSSLGPETRSNLRSQFEDVALSSGDIIARATSTKWPGSALPWRVIHVKLANSFKEKKEVRITALFPSSSKSRRPSKKRRIIQRRRLAAKAEAVQQQNLAEETKREKRTRKNREKKVRKKEREKRKKASAKGADVTVPGVDDLEEDP